MYILAQLGIYVTLSDAGIANLKLSLHQFPNHSNRSQNFSLPQKEQNLYRIQGLDRREPKSS